MNYKATSESSLYLSLNISDKAEHVIKQLNHRYPLHLDPDRFVNNQVFLDQTGNLRIDLINVQTNLTEWIVKHRQDDSEQPYLTPEVKLIRHPKLLDYPEIMQYQSVLINTKQELEFLLSVPLETNGQYSLTSLDKAHRLMELLNQYRIGPGWSCNPGGAYTTAYFKVLYVGPFDTMPDEYKLNPNVSFVAVVELTGEAGPVVYSLTVG